MNRTILYLKITVPFFILLLANVGSAQLNVVTQHNDLKRTGWNDAETQLTQANVSSGNFGKIFTRRVDDQIYTQPLVVSHVSIGGGIHNVVYVATVNNTVYAFDADDSAANTPYWQENLTFDPSLYRVPTNVDLSNAGACAGSYHDFSGNMGIVGTPVIDTNSNTMYVVARSVSNDGTNFVQYLHALDITTGNERSNSPVLITATSSGTGNGNVGGIITFNAMTQNQRPALCLYDSVVYISWASHCDLGPYHGWLIGYDASTLQQKYVYNASPNGYYAGIWMSGQAPAVDDSGYIYVATGNGAVGSGTNPNDTINRGESLLKLSTHSGQLKVIDFFTPLDYSFLNTLDLDYGTDGVMLIPGTHLSLSGSKEGILYLIDNSAMGGTTIDNSNVLQTLNVNSTGSSFYRNLHGSPVYFKDNNNNEYVYAWASSTSTSPGFLKQFPFNRATMLFDTLNTIIGNTKLPTGKPGAMLSVSSDGTKAGTGILWASHPVNGNANYSIVPGELQAFDATDITKELWNSNWDAKRDSIGNFAKFVCPTIANGKVYMASFSNSLNVYGLNPPQASPCTGNLPVGWNSVDIGYTIRAGDVCYDNGTYTISGSGSDIISNADAFHYYFSTNLPNSSEIRVRIDSLQSSNPTSKCGIMFRANLDPGSPNVFIALSRASGGFVQSRMTQNDTTAVSQYTGIVAPYWVRVVNNGNTYIGYVSPDGSSWSPLDTVTISLGTHPYVGIAFTSHNNNNLGTAVFDSLTLVLPDVLSTNLVNFTIKNIENRYAQLKWTELNDSNINHFEIERSSPTTDFVQVGSETSAGGATTNNYTFNDLRPLNGVSYYRIKILNLDGSVMYSNILQVTFSFDVLTIYPNPAHDQIFIENNDLFTKNRDLSVLLTDFSGRIIYKMVTPTAGLSVISMNVPQNLSRGMYVLWFVNSEGNKQAKKVYIIH